MSGFRPEDIEALNARIDAENSFRFEREELSERFARDNETADTHKHDEISQLHGLFLSVHGWALKNRIPYNDKTLEDASFLGIVRFNHTSGWKVFDNRVHQKAMMETKSDYVTGEHALMLPDGRIWWSRGFYSGKRLRSHPVPMRKGVEELSSYYRSEEVQKQLFQHAAAMAVNAGVRFELE